MLAGAFVAFPMGGVFGFVTGWISGSLTAFFWGRFAGRSIAQQAGAATLIGAGAGLAGVAGWLA